MSLLEALVLGLVQGLTEFLPISSSGHLVLVPTLMGWEKPPLAYDVLLHAATLLAVLIYFRRELIEALDGIGRPSPARRFIGLLVLATIPAAVIGVLFEGPLSAFFENPSAVSRFLIITGLMLLGAETLARRRHLDESIENTQLSNVEKISLEVSWASAFAIGCAQAVAILPGISRSGSTISTGLLTGLSRAQAARFSFMLSIPVLIGTAVAKVPQLETSAVGLGPILVGAAAAFVSAYFAIAGMIGYLLKRGLYPFALYCLVVGTVVSIVLARL